MRLTGRGVGGDFCMRERLGPGSSLEGLSDLSRLGGMDGGSQYTPYRDLL